MSDAPKGFKRGKDGILQVAQRGFDARHYSDPGEAVKTWRAGELRLGCAEKRFQIWSSFPCGKPAKHDPDHNGNPTRCGIHSAAAKAKRKAKQEAKDAANRAKWAKRLALQQLSQEAPEIIRQIAEGHNDPRALCQDWLDRRAAITKESE